MPPTLVGRERVIRRFEIAIQRLSEGRHQNSFLLMGRRGVGKTVLLREFGRIAEHRGWICRHIEAGESQDFEVTVDGAVREALARLSSRGAVLDHVSRLVDIVKSFHVRWQIPGGGDVEMGLNPRSDLTGSHSMAGNILDIFVETGRIAKKRGRGVLITIDETQFLEAGLLSSLMKGLHRISQERLPILVIGTTMPWTTERGDTGATEHLPPTYAGRVFEHEFIDRLEHFDARAALAEPAEAVGVCWNPDALDLVVDLTRGYPFYLQVFGKHVWDIAVGPNQITVVDVEMATPHAYGELDSGFFRRLIERTTHTERSYLARIACLGSGPYANGDVARVLEISADEVHGVLNSLIKREILYISGMNDISFAVPMFAEFARRTLM